MNFQTWSDGPEGVVSEADSDEFGEDLRLSGKAQSGRAVGTAGKFADAGVYCLNDTQALVATADFITPPVDDPVLFGQIAAATLKKRATLPSNLLMP